MIEVLTGDNDHAINEHLRKSIDDFVKNHGGSIERFDGAEITSSDQVLDAVRSISFLDPRKLVIVRSFEQSKELLEATEEIISQTAESTDLVIIGNFDKRSSAYKYLQKNTGIKIYADMSAPELARWIVDYVKKQGGDTDIQAANYLIEQVATNLYRIKNELDKMLLVDRKIDRDLIDELVEPIAQSKVFSLLDFMFNGQPKRAWEMYKDQRSQGEEPYKILAMISWQLQQLTLAVFAPQKTKEILISGGMSPYSAQKNLQMSRTISAKKLKYYIEQLASIDYQSKTSASIESALAVYIADVSVQQSTSS